MFKIPSTWRTDQSYQKLPGYNWRVDPYYRLDKDHPVPFNRPQVQALISKLRKMEMMKQPGTAEEVIYDIAYTQLYSAKQEVRMAKIAARLTHMWVGMRGNEDIYGPPEPQNLGQVEALSPVATAPSGGDSPSIDLDNKQLKDQVQHTIENHRLDFPHGLCGCNRSFATEEEWARHLRIRIWNVMKNEFPPMGSNNE